MDEIILWDCNIERIHACETAVYQALREIGYNARLIVNSEMPLLSRHQLWERLPVLEIRGQYWSLCPGCAFTTEQLSRLFRRIFIEQMAICSSPAADADTRETPTQTADRGVSDD
jgi:hypothetical protein